MFENENQNPDLKNLAADVKNMADSGEYTPGAMKPKEETEDDIDGFTPIPTVTPAYPANGPVIVLPGQDTPRVKDVNGNAPQLQEKALNGAPVKAQPSMEISMDIPETTRVDASDLQNPAPTANAPINMSITEDDLRSVMPDIDDDKFKKIAPAMVEQLTSYQKNLVMYSGFTPEEALQATKSKMAKEGQIENAKYLEENPRLGIVEIDKTREKDLQFTDEEKAVLSKVKAIKLRVVETEDVLASKKVRKLDRSSKMGYIKTIDTTLSKYEIPLPTLGDFVSFKGAQIAQLAITVQYDDAKLEETIGRKASLIYDRFISGGVLKKYDDRGNVELGYTDFLQKFPYYDMDIALYAILVASSMEMSTTQLTCGSCQTPFKWEYRMSSILNLDNVPDGIKETIDKVLEYKSNAEELTKINESTMGITTYESPFTKNIYSIAQPSIADAIRIYGAIDQTDKAMMSVAQIALFIRSMYLHDTNHDEYIEIDGTEELDILLETLQTIPQRDVNMLSSLYGNMMYFPRFTLKSKCKTCGTKMENRLQLDQLIFLSAQDSVEEMEQS